MTTNLTDKKESIKSMLKELEQVEINNPEVLASRDKYEETTATILALLNDLFFSCELAAYSIKNERPINDEDTVNILKKESIITQEEKTLMLEFAKYKDMLSHENDSIVVDELFKLSKDVKHALKILDKVIPNIKEEKEK